MSTTTLEVQRRQAKRSKEPLEIFFLDSCAYEVPCAVQNKTFGIWYVVLRFNLAKAVQRFDCNPENKFVMKETFRCSAAVANVN